MVVREIIGGILLLIGISMGFVISFHVIKMDKGELEPLGFAKGILLASIFIATTIMGARMLGFLWIIAVLIVPLFTLVGAMFLVGLYEFFITPMSKIGKILTIFFWIFIVISVIIIVLCDFAKIPDEMKFIMEH
ncbi:MAG: hypothetical protein AB1630_11570 [bacterium]